MYIILSLITFTILIFYKSRCGEVLDEFLLWKYLTKGLIFGLISFVSGIIYYFALRSKANNL